LQLQQPLQLRACIALLCLTTTLALCFRGWVSPNPTFFLAGLNPPPVRKLEKPEDFFMIATADRTALIDVR
jgi:hypothetical protein